MIDEINGQEQRLFNFRADRDALMNRNGANALSILKQVKPIKFFNDKIATSGTVAHYYSISIDTARGLLRNHHKEFVNDGMLLLRGKELSFVRSHLDIPIEARKLQTWSPRAVLRLGYLLQFSPAAHQVRLISLEDGDEEPLSTIKPRRCLAVFELLGEKGVIMNAEFEIKTSRPSWASIAPRVKAWADRIAVRDSIDRYGWGYKIFLAPARKAGAPVGAGEAYQG